MDDRHLVRRMLRGDEAAFETFFDDHASRLYRFANARLRDGDAAEEVVQVTFVKAFRNLATFRGDAPLFSWLCAICRHEISRWLTRRNRRADVPLTEDVPEVRAALEAVAASPSAQPDEALRREELMRLVQVTLDCLPPRYADALECKYIEGLSVQDMALRLQTTPKAVESLLSRARAAFRDGFQVLTTPAPSAHPSLRRANGDAS